MTDMKWLKWTLPFWLVVLTMGLVILPAAADEIGGTDITLSSAGAGSPDIEVSSNGQFVAVAYYKQATGAGPVYVKSATASDGWLTSTFLGNGSNPQLAFSPNSNSTIYVVWAESGNTAIQSAKCTLAALVSPNCTPGAVVTTTVTASLASPDVAVDDSGTIHAVWENNGFIETALSTNDLGSWSSAVQVAGGGFDQKPVLAWSGDNSGRLHLAFLRGSSFSTPTSVQYRRSQDSPSHSWTNVKSFTLGTEIIQSTVHDRIENPTIAAINSNIFLAWDTHRVSGDFSLMYANSTDNGVSWPGGPAFAFYVPSGNNASTTDLASEIKFSSDPGIPFQETALRPSLAISTTSSAAIVWDQFPSADGCTSFDTSLIYFANPPTGVAADTLSNDGSRSIDPDLAVAGGERHFVYMKDNSGDPCGGTESNYIITYRGPFTITSNDQGEGSNGLFLPIIMKNG